MIPQHTLDAIEFGKVRDVIAENAASVFGKESIRESLPLSDPSDIKRALALADEMAQAVRWGDPVPMGGIRDIRQPLILAARAGAALEPDVLLDIADTLKATAKLRRHFESRAEKYPRIWDIASGIHDSRGLIEEIESKIDPAGYVRDRASAALSKLRRSLNSERESLRSSLDRLVNRLSSDVVGDRIVSVRAGRPVIPVKAGQAGAVPGIIHDQSASGQTVFIEPVEAVQQSNHIRQLEIEEHREVKRILTEITDSVRNAIPSLKANVSAIREIDRLYAIAVFADRVNAAAPRMDEGRTFELVDMRHPLLDIRMRASGGEGAVPATARLKDGQQLVIISGPNAGGKTVALKSIGLACAMAQAGFLIPADSLTLLPVFETIFAEIGDEQSIEQDLSTFSSRMGNLAGISDNADDRTLILVDELGSATDPDQGAALSRALLTHWADRGARVFATTHLGALKEFAHEHPAAVNASMEFNRESLSPSFRLRVGLPGSSYALEISRRVGLSPEIIANAEKDLGELTVRTEELIAELTTQLETAATRAHELELRERKLEEREKDYAERFEKVNADRKRLEREARQAAEKVLTEARSLVERTVQEIRSTQASTESIRHAHRGIQKALADTRTALKRSEPRERSTPKTLQTGDWVKIRNLNLKGQLVAFDKNRAAVQTDTARMEVSPDQIERLENPPSHAGKRGSVSVTSDAKETFRTEIDVRGMTFDEAWSMVDRYLDDALLAHYPVVRIIHGKGTGALRKKFDAQLAQDPRVESHGLGELHEGGAGVTVAKVRM